MKRMKKGFTLIELMIVIAIIAIIAAIAIPSLLASRIQANETNAIAGLKAYATAQVTFRKAGFGNVAGNVTAALRSPQAFCDLPWQLCAGGDGTAATTINLISPTFAGSMLGVVIAPPITAAAPFQGYNFGNDTNAIFAAGSATWLTNFGLLAYPANFANSGYNVFYIGLDGTVYQQNGGTLGGVRGAIVPLVGAALTPSTSPMPANWTPAG